MTFTFATNNRIASRWNGSTFVEEVLTVSGADGVAVSQDATMILVSGQGAALSGALQADINSRVLRAGDTMSGVLYLSSNPIVSGLQATTKSYVDAQSAAAAIMVKNNGTTVTGVARFLDFVHALDVAVSSSGVTVTLNENEFDPAKVVMATGTQNISGDKTFMNNVAVLGNLSVTGALSILDTEHLLVEDNKIILNASVTGTPLLDAFFEVNRGNQPYAELQWDEFNDRWLIGVSGAMYTVIDSSSLGSMSGVLQADINTRVLRAGDTMSGSLYLAADPSSSGEASNKHYVDIQAYAAAQSGVQAASNLSGVLQPDIDSRVLKAGDTMTGNLVLSGVNLLAFASGVDNVGSSGVPFAHGYFNIITLSGAPANANDAATKAYVDSMIAGAAVIVKDHTVMSVASASILDFSTGLQVASGGSTATISVKENEFSTVVFLSGDQTLSGTKTFASPVVLASGAEPATITGTGVAGEVRWADDYLYVATGANSWKRVALAQF